jgi:ubiquinone/menaquinone biosynthesis C-methylase UbiE
MTNYLFKYTKTSEIFCLDISKDMLNILKNKLSKQDNRRASFICGDATDYIKSTKEKFDIICVQGSLHHMFDYLDLINSAFDLKKDVLFLV